MQTKLLTTRDVAQMMQVCEQTVRNWCKGIFYDKGQAKAYRKLEPLKSVKIGGTFRIYESDLNRFLESAKC